MPREIKRFTFETQRSGSVHVEGSKERQVRAPKMKEEAKPGKLDALVKKIPAHVFKDDAFDNVTSRARTQKDDGRGNSEFVGTRAGTRGSSTVEFQDGQLSGHYRREAVAGVYAEKSGVVTGRHGSASYQAEGKAEASASVDAKATLDRSGLNARVDARAHASVEVSASGEARTRKVTLSGVEMDAGVKGSGRAVAELNAEVSGRAELDRDTALLEGKAGASAIAKVEGDVDVDVGPLSFRGSAYGSAGAEAQASGIIGYDDGKFTIGGSAGAAFGLGAGGDAVIEVDVEMIGEAAKNAADVNDNGKLDVGDAVVAARRIGSGAKKVAGAADRLKDRIFG